MVFHSTEASYRFLKRFLHHSIWENLLILADNMTSSKRCDDVSKLAKVLFRSAEASYRSFEAISAPFDQENFADNAARELVFNKYTELSARVMKIKEFGEKGDMSILFEKARSAHSDLLRQASGLSIGELPQHIEKFRQRAILLRQVFDDIHS